MALVSSRRVFHFLRLSNSFCMLDQNDSIITIERVTNRAERRHETRVADPLGEGPGSELDSVIGVDHGSPLHTTLLDRHVEGVHDKLGVLDRVNGPAHDASTARVEHATAVDLAFTRGVFRDVRDPQLVERRPLELALDEIVRRRGALHTLDLARPRNTRDLGIVHQDRHEHTADVDAATLGQFGVHAARPIGAAAVGVDLSDESGESLSTDHRG